MIELALSLPQKIELKQKLQLICSVCDRPRNIDHEIETATYAQIFGAKKYSICPCCMVAVTKKMYYDQEWRKKFNEFVAKKILKTTTICGHRFVGFRGSRRWFSEDGKFIIGLSGNSNYHNQEWRAYNLMTKELICRDHYRDACVTKVL